MNVVIWLQLSKYGGGTELLKPALRILDKLSDNKEDHGKVERNALNSFQLDKMITLNDLIKGSVNNNRVVGFIVEAPKNVNVEGVKIIKKYDLKDINYDVILVTGDNASIESVTKEVTKLGEDADKVVLDRTVCVPNFTMEKYNKLRHSELSIISMNRWGGFIYRLLGLPILSPTIDVRTSEEDFLKFLKDPMKNFKKKPSLERTEFNAELNINYPVFKIGDTLWSMNHESNAGVARKKWSSRSNKINWLNFAVTMHTDKPEILAEFDKLPFAKKICIVSFQTDLESGYFIDPELSEKGEALNYDIWDMLMYGKKTPIPEAHIIV